MYQWKNWYTRLKSILLTNSASSPPPPTHKKRKKSQNTEYIGGRKEMTTGPVYRRLLKDM